VSHKLATVSHVWLGDAREADVLCIYTVVDQFGGNRCGSADDVGA